MFAQTTQTQLPVSCFRFNKVYTAADQLMGTHELVVDYLLNNIEGQNWLMHWTPNQNQNYTECMVFFPDFALDRVNHIRPLANFFQQHLLEDPAIIYRPRNEFIEVMRSCDMNQCNQLDSWGLTTMSRLNNTSGRAIQETRTKMITPTQVVHKFITREVPILGQQFVSPLARCVAPMTTSMNCEADIVGNLLLGNNVLSGTNFPGSLGSRLHSLRGLGNLVENNMLGRCAPIGLSRPIGLGVTQDTCLGVDQDMCLGQGQQGLGYAQLAQNWLPFQSISLNQLNQLNNPHNNHNCGTSLQTSGMNMPARIISGLNQAVCQTLNPAVCEQQQTTAVKVTTPVQQQTTQVCQTSPMVQQVRIPFHHQGIPFQHQVGIPMVNKVVY